MQTLLTFLLFICLSVPVAAQELVIVTTDVSKDSEGREITTDLAALLLSTIKVVARSEYFPPARAAAYLAQKDTSACSILARASIDQLRLIPVREVLQEDIVLADFASPGPKPAETIGSLNNILYFQIADAHGMKLHTVPSIESAAAMLKSGRLSRFLGLNGMIVTMARNNGLQILSAKSYGAASVWLGCAQDTPLQHQRAFADAWNELLIADKLQAVYSRHNSGAGLLPPIPATN